ncbi:MAG: Rne/Rng family ribonuclease [Verrucomicrobia bacterium]|nr:Rne/Rng family ribonuclease [Verrucomicrobiota bacterium]
MLKFTFSRKKPSNKEIIINAETLEKRVALLENGRLEEFHIERTTEQRLVGSIFKGRIKNLEPGLKAAFVDIGFEKNAFLHYWDIIPESTDATFEAVETKGSKGQTAHNAKPRPTMNDIPKLYPPGTEVIVQVTKGPISTKGPRITTDISLPGRYLVLNPFGGQSGISRKIEDPRERARLRDILRNMTVPEGMGVIFRTVGMGQSRRYFVRDLALLVDEWQKIAERIKAAPASSCVYQEPGLVYRTVRDFLTEEVDRIVVDHAEENEHIRALVGQISNRSKNKVQLYSESSPIFERFGVNKQIEDAFRRQVWLKCGGYVVIDETEALVAIDVNTGRNKSGRDLERTILQTNLEAAEEIARQIRLRNIGGIIVIDFIDMKNRRDQQEVTNRLRECVRRDKAKTHILPISPVGLTEMTRQRQEESIRDAVYEDCPNCKGRGMIKSSESMSVEIQRRIAEVLRKRGESRSDTPGGGTAAGEFSIRVIVHPEVLERLRTRDEELLLGLEQRLSGKLSFRADAALHKEEFKLVNPVNGEELR